MAARFVLKMLHPKKFNFVLEVVVFLPELIILLYDFLQKIRKDVQSPDGIYNGFLVGIEIFIRGVALFAPLY